MERVRKRSIERRGYVCVSRGSGARGLKRYRYAKR